jgi:hypothetical protein
VLIAGLGLCLTQSGAQLFNDQAGGFNVGQRIGSVDLAATA